METAVKVADILVQVATEKSFDQIDRIVLDYLIQTNAQGYTLTEKRYELIRVFSDAAQTKNVFRTSIDHVVDRILNAPVESA